MQDTIIDEKVLMMWRNHTEEVLDMHMYRTKVLLEEVCDATLERPNASFLDKIPNTLLLIYWR